MYVILAKYSFIKFSINFCYSCNLILKRNDIIQQYWYFVLILIVTISKHLHTKIHCFDISNLVTDFVTSHCKKHIFYNKKVVVYSNNFCYRLKQNLTNYEKLKLYNDSIVAKN